MGEQDVKSESDAKQLRVFMKHLLRDVRAFETMLDQGMVESGVRRLGAEQEMFLVDEAYKAAPIAMEVLDAIKDPHFTTELALFNLECNLDPQVYGGGCLRSMEQQLRGLLAKAQKASVECGGHVVLTGILPTLQKSDLDLAYMTPRPRYFALNDAMNQLRGEAYEFRIKGADEFRLRHDSVMLEACNTSFQVHFQVGPEEFAKLYNIAQAVTAPVLSVATNSPLLLGRRLWAETRIALFQQSIDTRAVGAHMRDTEPRVTFGSRWVDESVLEIFREDVTRFRVLLGADAYEDPFEALERGEAPKFRALLLHNGTVYRWNRPCYGITPETGRPHLRIENRVLPAGPTVLDEMANAAFWFGLMSGMVELYPDIRKVMAFDDAKTNFLNAARVGMGADFTWVNGRTYVARDLIKEELLPLAREGLRQGSIDSADIDRYLGVIEERITSGQSGSSWALRSWAKMDGAQSRGEKLSALTSATIARQAKGEPIHTWPLAELEERAEWNLTFMRVEQFMTTDLFTVNESELVDLVASMMTWNNIRHVAVEDNQHKLVGLVDHASLLRLLGDGRFYDDDECVPVRSIMQTDPITVTPDTLTLDVIRTMRTSGVTCLPVVQDGELVGMVTERDFMNIARELLEERLEEGAARPTPRSASLDEAEDSAADAGA